MRILKKAEEEKAKSILKLQEYNFISFGLEKWKPKNLRS
mgnify:CR=1 FL=1